MPAPRLGDPAPWHAGFFCFFVKQQKKTAVRKWSARLRAVIAAEPDRPAAQQVADHDPVGMPLANRDLVDPDHLQVPDPVGAGFVESLAQPGGNVTGFTSYEYSIGGKRLELLKEIAPTIKRAAPLRDPGNPAGSG